MIFDVWKGIFSEFPSGKLSQDFKVLTPSFVKVCVKGKSLRKKVKKLRLFFLPLLSWTLPSGPRIDGDRVWWGGLRLPVPKRKCCKTPKFFSSLTSDSRFISFRMARTILRERAIHTLLVMMLEYKNCKRIVRAVISFVGVTPRIAEIFLENVW